MKVPAAKICFPKEDREVLLKQIDGILESGQLTLGKYTKEFEEKFASTIGTKYAVAVNSGTSSIEIPMRIFDVSGKEVIVPTNTFAATAFGVVHAGGKVKFADVDPNTHAISLETVKKQITKKTKAVVSVHIGGNIAPDTEELKEFCEKKGIIFFEDAAHAHGSKLNGKHAGTFGLAGSFSFYPTKVMTSAEGGMIVTNDKIIYDRAMVFRDQGKSGFTANLHTEMGYNWRLSEVHAAIGVSQLKRLESFIADRRRVAKIYDEGLKNVPHITSLKIPSNSHTNYYKYIAILDKGLDRKAIKQKLREQYEVSLSGEVYELPLHLQPIFMKMGYKQGDFPVAEDVCARQVCLPLFPTMTDEMGNFVIDSLKKVLA
ncbi:MAG: DegT/DnrJ/EryC1/StrS family aminotransferase [Thermoplasmata archaeon]